VSTSADALSPAPIAVEERVLEDLRSRLRATIWPEDDGNEDGRYGVPRALLQELVRYWAQEYDWRAAERAMNAYEHYLDRAARARGAQATRPMASGGYRKRDLP